ISFSPMRTSFSASPPASSASFTLSLHDALPILRAPHLPDTISSPYSRVWTRNLVLSAVPSRLFCLPQWSIISSNSAFLPTIFLRSEEHTSELQSRENLVCRLLLDRKKLQELK